MIYLLCAIFAALTVAPPCIIYYSMHPETDTRSRVLSLAVMPFCILALWALGFYLLQIGRLL